MPVGLWYVVTFFVGAFVGRYFEDIIHFIGRMRSDLEKAQKDIGKSIQAPRLNNDIGLNFPKSQRRY